MIYYDNSIMNRALHYRNFVEFVKIVVIGIYLAITLYFIVDKNSYYFYYF